MTKRPKSTSSSWKVQVLEPETDKNNIRLSQARRPIVVTLPSAGCTSKDAPLQWQYFGSQDERKPHQRKLLAATSRAVYSAANFNTEAKPEWSATQAAVVSAMSGAEPVRQDVKYAVGIMDPSTQKVTFIEATWLNGSVASRQVLDQVYVEASKVKEVAQLTAREENTRLGEAFGSKKRKKTIRAAEMNRVDVATLNESTVDHISATIDAKVATLPTAADMDAQLDASRPLPPYNRDAEDPMKVYDLDDLVSPPLVHQMPVGPLLKMHGEELDNFEKDESIYPLFTRLRIARLIRAQLDTKTRRSPALARSALSALLMLSYLIRFHAVHKRGSRLISTIPTFMKAMHGVPPTISHFLRDTFTEKTEEVQGDETKTVYQSTPISLQRLLCHIACLTVHTEENRIPLDPLAQCMKIPVDKLRVSFVAIGCTVTLQTGHVAALAQDDDESNQNNTAEKCYVASLRVPLTLPKPRMRGARK